MQSREGQFESSLTLA
nr:unnamed protein product [Callosobruchus chinensis]